MFGEARRILEACYKASFFYILPAKLTGSSLGERW